MHVGPTEIFFLYLHGCPFLNLDITCKQCNLNTTDTLGFCPKTFKNTHVQTRSLTAHFPNSITTCSAPNFVHPLPSSQEAFPVGGELNRYRRCGVSDTTIPICTIRQQSKIRIQSQLHKKKLINSLISFPHSTKLVNKRN